MNILNIAGYKFLPLADLADLQSRWLSHCESLELKGTILLSAEGVNITLAGTRENIDAFRTELRQDERFDDMTFRESFSTFQPFEHIKVKIKPEIITMRQPDLAVDKRAPSISPQEFKQWLDEKRDITVLDTRNDYEVRFGTFAGAINLHINDFNEFPHAASEKTPREKPVVMFCTGGIRCEKAALQLLNDGYSEVYQLDGGILNYFAEVGGDHYHGECFVFDQRVSVDPDLQVTGTQQCVICEGPIKATSDSCVTCRRAM
jgi:UPF0176 protein